MPALSAEARPCSSCGPSPPPTELTLTDIKRTLALASKGQTAVSSAEVRRAQTGLTDVEGSDRLTR